MILARHRGDTIAAIDGSDEKQPSLRHAKAAGQVNVDGDRHAAVLRNIPRAISGGKGAGKGQRGLRCRLKNRQ